jgi:hypothetical protein
LIASVRYLFIFHLSVVFGQWLPSIPSTEQIFGIDPGKKSKEQITLKTISRISKGLMVES